MRQPVLVLLTICCFLTTCNRNFSAVLPEYEGWEILLLENKRGSIVADRVEIFFDSERIPANYERLVLITAPISMDQVGANEWAIAREYAGYYGARGVFLQPNTAAYNFRTQQDSLRFYNQRIQAYPTDERQANFFGIRY